MATQMHPLVVPERLRGRNFAGRLLEEAHLSEDLLDRVLPLRPRIEGIHPQDKHLVHLDVFESSYQTGRYASRGQVDQLL